MKCVPERGRIGIFNRSYYEETLVVRVHKEFLEKETIPPKLLTEDIWKERFQDIHSFERYLTRNCNDIKERAFWDDYMKA